jgi:AcrR family transcriptional regulator
VTVSVSADRTESEVARHIAREAARLFAARGYDATPVRAIVEAAGVTKPTLYYHFGSKEGLAQALLTVPLRGLVGRLRSILEGPGDPVEKLERSFEAHFDFSREDPDRSRLFFAVSFGPLGSGLAELFRASCEDLAVVMAEAARPFAEAGLIAPDRVDDFVAACRGMIVMSVMDFLYQGVELRPGLSRRLVGDLLHGFGRYEGAGDSRGVTR